MQKAQIQNEIKGREIWLRAGAEAFRPDFAKRGLVFPTEMRCTVGFTSQGTRGKAEWELWPPEASDDRHYELIMRLDVASTEGVLINLAGALVRACFPPDTKDRKKIREAALKIGLSGSLRKPVANDEFKERLHEIAEGLGPFPHASVNFDRVNKAGLLLVDLPKKQTTRMLKACCGAADCGYTVRVAASWIRDVGAPHCPRHGAMQIPTIMSPDEEILDDDVPVDGDLALTDQE